MGTAGANGKRAPPHPWHAPIGVMPGGTDKKTAREIPVLSILVVIDEPARAAAVAQQLSPGPLRTRVIHDPLEVLDALSEREVDIVLTDLDVVTPHGGIALARVLRASDEHRDVGIVLRAPGEPPAEARAVVDATLAPDAPPLELRSTLFDVAMLSRERRRKSRG